MLAVLDEVELSEAGVTPQNRARWQRVFAERDSGWWFRAFGAADVPCMVVRDLGDCFTDEQVRDNEYCVQVDDAVIGPSLQVGSPVTLCNPVSAAARAYCDAVRRLKGESIPMTIPTDKKRFMEKLFGRRAA